jgi:hypothetical protein
MLANKIAKQPSIPYSVSKLDNQNTHLFGHKINIDNLINICTAKLQQNPNHRKALFIRASSFMKKKMYFEAIEDCHKLLNMDSRYVGAYFIIGCAHEKLD